MLTNDRCREPAAHNYIPHRRWARLTLQKHTNTRLRIYEPTLSNIPSVINKASKIKTQLHYNQQEQFREHSFAGSGFFCFAEMGWYLTTSWSWTAKLKKKEKKKAYLWKGATGAAFLDMQ